MKFLYDTDHITFFTIPTSREYALIQRRAAAYASSDMAFSVASFHEQVLGAHAQINRAKSTAHTVRGYAWLSKLLTAYRDAIVLPFDLAAATEFDALRAAGVRIATTDLRIASIAKANNLTVLTRNAKDFAKVPGLVIEDWIV